jgi:uncharacterized membrane protein YfcA
LIVTFLRGSNNFESVLGISKCGAVDWTLVGSLVLIMFIFSYIGVKINKKEQALKMKVGRGRGPSDLTFTGKQLLSLCFFAFVGGWVSGALGLGGGSIFNPLMISMGIPPSVSTATGMYMIMFSTAASSTIYIVYGAMNIQFAIWLSIWSSMGILTGITIVNKLMKKYKRQSILVFILVGVLAMSALLVPIQSVINLMATLENGNEIWKITSICG